MKSKVTLITNTFLIIQTSDSYCMYSPHLQASSSRENYARPLVFHSPCLRENTEPVTMLDICSGNLHHLNLKHVVSCQNQEQMYCKHILF